MKNKNLLPFALGILLFTSLIIFTSCSKSIKPQPTLSADSKVTRTDKNVERSDKEYLKAGYFGLSKRYSYSFFYKDGIEDGGELVEEVTFDTNGNRIEQIKYSLKGDIDYRYKFSYNDDNQLVSMNTFDAEDKLLFKKTLEYDEKGHNIMTKEDDIVDSQNNKYTTFNWVDSLLVERVVKNMNDDILITEKFAYDSLGYKYVNYKSDPNGVIISTYYTHDEFGNIKEIVAPYFKVVFIYDEKGNTLTEELYDTQSRQHKFIYEYDDNGLLICKTRYDLKENPIFKMEFKYDFH